MSDMHPLSGAYAVDALDDLERARFERHLSECPDCAAEVASLQEAAALLALSVDTGPSAAMRSRVLAEISTVRPLPPSAPAQEVVRRTARRFPRLVAAAAAVVLVAGGVGVSALHPWTDDPNRPIQVAPVAARVMDAPDARNQSVAFDDGSRATLWHSRSVGRAVVVTKDMAPAPSGKVYELWLQDADGTFLPAGLMDGGNQTFVLHGALKHAKGVGITVEPAAGSKTPTSVPVAMFDFEKSV